MDQIASTSDDFVGGRTVLDDPRPRAHALRRLAPLAEERTHVLQRAPGVLRLDPWSGRRSEVVGQGDEAAAGACDVLAWHRSTSYAEGAVGARRAALAVHDPRRAARDQPTKVDAPIRVAVTGRTVGLPLFEILEYLGSGRDPRPDCGWRPSVAVACSAAPVEIAGDRRRRPRPLRGRDVRAGLEGVASGRRPQGTSDHPAHELGWSWREIANRLDLTKQAVHQRYSQLLEEGQ